MTGQKRLAPHEMLELHEILSFKTLCASKASAMMSMAQDPEIKKLLQDDISSSKQHIQRLEDFLRVGLENPSLM
ncbi:MAG: hypothetical protein ACM3MK_01790 [Chitinophagales bacterium]